MNRSYIDQGAVEQKQVDVERGRILRPLFLILFISVAGCMAASAQVGSSWSTENGNKKRGMLQYYYTGDVGNVIAGLRADFGREQTLEQHVSGRRVVFYKATKPEWTDMKLDLELVVMSNDDKHVVFITCYGKKNVDFLAPASETAPKIKRYFDAVFPKEK